MARVRFEDFELDLAGGELRRAGVPIRLQPQPLRVLALLAGRAGQLVSRDELRRAIWADDTFVDFDQGLNYCIRRIRAALDDPAGTPRFIETVPRRGYRFRAAVEPQPAAARPMLVVLPFRNVGGDAGDEYFCDGLTEEVIAQLARLNPRDLAVISRTSAMQYKRREAGIAAIGRELGVSHALEGSVRHAGNRVRVTAQLIHVADQTHLWANTFERALGDVLALQADIAQAVAREIGVQLTPLAQQRFAAARPVNPAAYESHLKGRYCWKQRSRAALEESVRHFRAAIAADPGYAPSYAGLADVYLTQLDYNYLAPREAFALADRVLLDALRLDNTVAEPHTSLGHLRLHQYDWHAAAQQFGHAIELNAGYDTAHYYHANLLAAFGRFDDALVEADRAVALDPRSANTRQNRVFVRYLARQYAEAADETAAIEELDASYAAVHYYRGLLHERQGQYDRAIEAFEKVRRSGSRGATVLAAIGFAHANAGRRQQARAVLRRLEVLARREYVPSYELALLYLALDDRDAAFAQLAKAYDEYSSFLPFVAVDPRMDAVRADPRFEALVTRMNLAR